MNISRIRLTSFVMGLTLLAITTHVQAQRDLKTWASSAWQDAMQVTDPSLRFYAMADAVRATALSGDAASLEKRTEMIMGMAQWLSLEDSYYFEEAMDLSASAAGFLADAKRYDRLRERASIVGLGYVVDSSYFWGLASAGHEQAAKKLYPVLTKSLEGRDLGEDYLVMLNVSQGLGALGDVQEARKWIQRQPLVEDRIDALLWLSWIRYFKGDHAKSKQIFHEAYAMWNRLEPSDDNICLGHIVNIAALELRRADVIRDTIKKMESVTTVPGEDVAVAQMYLKYVELEPGKEPDQKQLNSILNIGIKALADFPDHPGYTSWQTGYILARLNAGKFAAEQRGKFDDPLVRSHFSSGYVEGVYDRTKMAPPKAE